MYSAVNVINPASRSHVALVHPGQRVKVSFHDVSIMDECKAVIQSDLVELVQETYNHGGKTFVFMQKYDMSAWAKVSTVFLGQVHFTGRGRINPAVSFYLATENDYKRDIVTALNPSDQTIKLYPHQILEVVTSSPLWGQDLNWECDPADQGAFELLSTTTIDPAAYRLKESIRNVNDAFFIYPRALETSAKAYLEYHWWFRLREMSAKLAVSFKCPPVSISMVGRVNGEIRVRQEFKVAINDRLRPDWQQSRSFQVTFEDSCMDKGEYDEYDDFSNQPFILPKLRTEQTSHQWQGHKRRHHKNQNGRIKGFVQGITHKQSRDFYDNYRPPYVKPFQYRDVGVILKPPGPLDHGCKTVMDDPIVVIKPQTALPSPKTAMGPVAAPKSAQPPLGYNFRGNKGLDGTKAGYYYDDDSDQWD